MSLNLICLIVDIFADSVKRTTQALWPEIQFVQADYSNSLNDAFQRLIECNYNLCFIHSTFKENLDSFFRDMRKLGRDRTCVFVQMWDQVPSELDRTEVLEMGFSAVVGREISNDDKLALREVLRLELRQHEIDRRVVDVQEAMRFVVKELDRVARDHQRGKNEKFDRIIRDFISMLTEYDDEVLDHYFDALAEESTQAPAFKHAKIRVPINVLKRRLPHLGEDCYTGQSRRVWEKLLRRYGAPRDEATSPELATATVTNQSPTNPEIKK